MEVVNIKKHQLSADNKDHFVILDDQGEEFKVAKHSLDPLTHEKIANLQKVDGYACGGSVKGYADGGEAPQPRKSDYAIEADEKELANQQAMMDDQKLKEQAANDTAAQNLEIKGKLAEQSTTGKTPVNYVAPEIPTPMVTPTPPGVPKDEIPTWAGASKAPPSSDVIPTVPQAVPQQAGIDTGGMYLDAARQAMGAARGEANSLQNVGKQVATAYKDSYDAMRDVQDHYKGTLDRLNAQAEQLIADGAQGKVDPNHYWNNPQAPNKIVSAISLIIGGMGSFATGGRNLAAETIDKAIDNDIAAQRANIANKDNLLARNLQLTGSMTQAMDATRSQLTAMAAAQIAGAQAQNIGPKAKTDLANFQMQLMDKVLQQNQTIAKNQSMMRLEGMGSQPATQQDLALNPEMQNRAVLLPTGHIGISYSPEEAKDLRNKISQNRTIFNIVDRLEKIGPSAAVSPKAKDEARGLMASLKLELAKSEDYKKYSEKLMDNIEDQFGDPTSLKRFIGIDPASKTSMLKKTLTDTLLNDFGSKLLNYTPPPVPRKTSK